MQYTILDYNMLHMHLETINVTCNFRVMIPFIQGHCYLSSKRLNVYKRPKVNNVRR